MQSLKQMFLGFLVMLVGVSWLISVGTALPGDGSTTISPLVAAFFNQDACLTPGGETANCAGNPALVSEQLMEIVRTQEDLALLVILAGLGIALVGYFRKDPHPPSKPPASAEADAPPTTPAGELPAVRVPTPANTVAGDTDTASPPQASGG